NREYVRPDRVVLRQPGRTPEVPAMPADPHRVKDLFVAALDLPDGPDRRAFLDRECGGDAGLRRRLDVLLAAHDRPGPAPRPPPARPGGGRRRGPRPPPACGPPGRGPPGGRPAQPARDRRR